MKALVLEKIGLLVYQDVPMPTPKAGEVLLGIKACGICSSDFDRCLKTGTYHFPTIPGHEFSGQIVAVGDGVDASLVGKRAVVFPLLPCRKCDQCQIEAFARCRNYNYFGSRSDGAFSEYLAAPLWNVQTFADSLDYKVAALCEPAAVAYHAARAAEICPGESVCVIGTGTIGLLAGIWARECGGCVTFVSRNAAKTDFIRTLGFNSFIEPDATASFDKVLECVGSDASLLNAVNVVNAVGTIVLVGNPDGDKTLPRKAYWKLLRSEVAVKGVWNSSYTSTNNEWRRVLSALETTPNTFSRLITSTFPLADGLDAFSALRSGRKLEIKGMFVNE